MPHFEVIINEVPTPVAATIIGQETELVMGQKIERLKMTVDALDARTVTLAILNLPAPITPKVRRRRRDAGTKRTDQPNLV